MCGGEGLSLEDAAVELGDEVGPLRDQVSEVREMDLEVIDHRGQHDVVGASVYVGCDGGSTCV